MDYLSLIKEQDAEKTALVTETCQYTYGQLARRAQAVSYTHLGLPEDGAAGRAASAGMG